MTDAPPPPPPSAPPRPPENPLQPAFIVYIIYAVGFAIPIAAIGGLVYAYVERGKSAELDSHLNFQIRTFWWGLLMVVVGTITAFILIGFVVLLFWAVWTIVRIITGIQLAQKQQPITMVEMFGMKAM